MPDIIDTNDFDFEKAFKESFKDYAINTVITATVLEVTEDTVFLNFGYKAEAKLATTDFETTPKVGDKVQVFLVSLESRTGEPIVSKKKVDYFNDKRELERAYKEREPLSGIVKETTKGGCIVDFRNVRGFIPISLFDSEKLATLEPFLNKEIKFYIEYLNFRKESFGGKKKDPDKKDEEFVGNRKRYMGEENNVSRKKFFEERNAGETVEGIVRSIADFGAFVDVGGTDALLHIKDISWVRIPRVDSVLKLGDKVTVQILNIDKEKRKVNVGLKQLQDDPWDKFVQEYKEDSVVVGTVQSITTYGAFVKIIDGVEGLLHISDMSWTKKIKSPGDLVKTGQKLEVKIIKIDTASKRVTLSLKHLLDNPWDDAETKYGVGQKVKGKIKTITTFGVFLELEEGVDALLHIDDVSWTESIRNPHKYFKVGDDLEAMVIQCEPKKAKIKVGLKQLEDDPWMALKDKHKIGDLLKCEIESIDAEKGLNVKVTDKISTFIPLNHISFGKKEEIKESIADVYKVGEMVDTVIINLDPRSKKLSLSIKEYLKKIERDKVETFLHDDKQDSTYTLGDMMKTKDDKEQR